jgi:DNA-binding response OmpR family regulator
MRDRILVVDDDNAACGFVRDTLTHDTGAEVLALTNSNIAASFLTKERFVLVIFDLKMPEPNGLDLAQHARKSSLNQATPIIMVSEDQSAAAISHGFAAGAEFFLYKPIDTTRLIRLVRAMQRPNERDKRRFKRVPVQLPVRLEFEKWSVQGQTINISLSGMLVRTDAPIPTPSSVRVSLYAPKGTEIPITASASVVRSLSGNRFGIQLNRLAPVENSRFQEFLLPIVVDEEGAVRDCLQ